MDIVKRCFDTW